MERYLGIDAHDESSTIVVLGPSGRLIRQLTVETQGRPLVEAVKGISGRKRLCLEESPLSEWLYELLGKHVESIEVVQAEWNRGTKSDVHDARWLADALRTNATRRRVFKPTTEQRELREAVRAYQVTVTDLCRTKNRLNALIRSRAIRPKTDELYDAETRGGWIKKLPAALRPRAELFGQMVDMATVAHMEATGQLEAIAKKEPMVKRLMTAPGIGLLRAAIVVAVVVTPHRFRTARQFWAYCGLAVVTQATSEWKKTGGGMQRRKDVVHTRGLNTNRHPWLKSVFKGAAHTVITVMRDHPLAAHYQRMVDNDGIKPSLAWLTISRRIAAAVLSMWKNEEVYDASKQEPKTAA